MKTIFNANLFSSHQHSNFSLPLKVFAMAIAILTLQACSSSSSDSSSDEEDDSFQDVAGFNSDLTFEDIAGVYRFIEDFEEDNNEIYVVITEEGDFTEYDYLGDAFDAGPNCYDEDIEDGFLVPQGGQIYLYDDDEDELFGKVGLNEDGDLYALVDGNAVDASALEPVDTVSETDLSDLVCD